MATDEVERLHYYERQFLGATDFEAAQTYQRNMRRRHSLGHHTLGIVVGLELVERPAEGDAKAVDVFVQPGLAIDGYGREILVLAPRRLEVPEFERFSDLRDREVWIRYREELGQRPQAGFEQCDEVDQFGRVRESFAIEVEPRPPRHDRVMIAGRDAIASTDATPATPEDTPRIPSDESVPHQDFVDDQGHRYWPIRLGTVSWDGVNRKFRKADHRLAQGRQYVSVVAQTVLAPAGSVRIMKREDYTPFDPAKEKGYLAAIEGTLRVDKLLTARGGIQLDGDRLDLRDEAGSATSRLEIYRESGLRVSLGEADRGSRFAIGIDPGFAEKFGVSDKGDVIAKGSLDVSGTVKLNERIEIRDPDGGPGNMWIQRSKGGADRELRVVIGDDEAGDDRFVVGPIRRGSADVAEKFAVVDNGDVSVARDLRVGGDLSVTSNATIGQSLAIARDLLVQRDLRVRRNLHAFNLDVIGTQNLIRVVSQTFARKNNGHSPRSWAFDYHGVGFTEIYIVFVTLQGHSLWANEGDITFSHMGHSASVNAIPQHVFVRVDDWDLTHAWGRHFVSESKASLELDNSVLFTVVVMGRAPA